VAGARDEVRDAGRASMTRTFSALLAVILLALLFHPPSRRPAEAAAPASS